MNDISALKTQAITQAYKEMVVGPFYLTIAIITLVIYVLCAIGLWKVFTKMGEKGWKALIPVYNVYILFKNIWNAKMFWTWIICLAFFFVFGSIKLGEPWTTVCLVLVFCLLIAMFILHILLMWKLSKSFEKGLGFFLGLLFFNYIFLIILGFGNSKFINQKLTEK